MIIAAGDVEAISSLSLISTGIGFTLVAESLENSELDALILIPAAGSVAATLIGQRSIRGAHLTDKQGSTINLATAGAALIGLGVATLVESESPAVWIGIPSGLAFITHQIMLHNYKMKNMELNFRGSRLHKRNYKLGLQVTPESYFINQRIPVHNYSPQSYSRLQNPIFKLSLTFLS